MNSVMRSGLMSVGSLVGREVGVCLRGMRKALAVVATAAGMGAGLTGAAHGQVVINGIYADGGNGGAAQHADWVELFNAGSSPVTIGGYQLLYASSTGTSWSGTTVTAGTVIQPRSFYLIRTSSIGLNGAALPNLDQSATSPNMAGGGGKLALYSTATTTSGQCPSATNLVDLVGWGTGNCAMVGGTPTAGGRNGAGTELVVVASLAAVYVDGAYSGAPGALVSFPVGGPAQGKVLGLNAFVTIQSAIDAADVGGTVSIAASGFAENLVVGKQLRIIGAGAGNCDGPADPLTQTVITSAAAGTPVVSITAGGTSAADRLTVSGLRLTGATGDPALSIPGCAAVRVTAATGTTLSFFRFDGLTLKGNAGAGLALCWNRRFGERCRCC